MRKTISILAMALCSAFVMAQTNQVVWLNGKVLYGHPITTIDSITYDMSGILEGDTLSLILPRSTRYVVHDTVTVVKKDTVSLFDTIIQANTVYVRDTIYINKCNSEGIGVFSVSADKQVSFSKGNLQYQASTKTWRFAENQYDYIGKDHVFIGEGDFYISDTTNMEWIDLFGWSGTICSVNFGTMLILDSIGYCGDFVDWGSNTIGMDAPDTWRTLSTDEWYYLFCTRTNADKLFGLGTINGINGIIILPDDWTTPQGISFTPSVEKGLANQGGYYSDNNFHWLDNTYSLSDWHSMEAAGAAFLPAAGYLMVGMRDNYLYGEAELVQNAGYYWSSTLFLTRINGYCQYFRGDHFNIAEHSDSYIDPKSNIPAYYGASVRLVQDL